MSKIVSQLKNNIRMIVISKEYRESNFNEELKIMKEYSYLSRFENPDDEMTRKLNLLAMRFLNKAHLDDLSSPLELDMIKRVKNYGLEISGLTDEKYSIKDFYSNVINLFHEIRWSEGHLFGLKPLDLGGATFSSLVKKVELFAKCNGELSNLNRVKERAVKTIILSDSKLELLKNIYETGNLTPLDKKSVNDINVLTNQIKLLPYTASINYITSNQFIGKEEAVLVCKDMLDNVSKYSEERKVIRVNRSRLCLSFSAYFRNFDNFNKEFILVKDKEPFSSFKDMVKLAKRMDYLKECSQKLDSRINELDTSLLGESVTFSEHLEKCLLEFDTVREEKVSLISKTFESVSKKIDNGITLSNGKFRKYDAIDYALFAVSINGFFCEESMIRHFSNRASCQSLINMASFVSESRDLMQPMRISEILSCKVNDFEMYKHPEVIDYLTNLWVEHKVPLFADVVNAAINRFEEGTLFIDNDKGTPLVKINSKKKETE